MTLEAEKTNKKANFSMLSLICAQNHYILAMVDRTE